MVQLVPMSDAEFQAYVDYAIPHYAQENVQTGRWPEDSSLDLARQEFSGMLPDGLATENQSLFSIRDEDAAVGMIWLGVRDRASGRKGYLYDILIYEPYRRRGFATQAFRLIEEEARAMGVSSIDLHVFGHNQAARALYTKLGYVTTNVMMSKDL